MSDDWRCPRCGSPELDEMIIEVWGICASCCDYQSEEDEREAERAR